MLEWVTAGGGARVGVVVHHTDAERNGPTTRLRTSADWIKDSTKHRNVAGFSST